MPGKSPQEMQTEKAAEDARKTQEILAKAKSMIGPWEEYIDKITADCKAAARMQSGSVKVWAYYGEGQLLQICGITWQRPEKARLPDFAAHIRDDMTKALSTAIANGSQESPPSLLRHQVDAQSLGGIIPNGTGPDESLLRKRPRKKTGTRRRKPPKK